MTFWKKVLSGEDKSFSASWMRGLAWLASKPYGNVTRLRNIAYNKGWLRSTKVQVPVISIGNLTVGGTGKTPAVAMVCRYLREHDIRVAVVSRGYGAIDGGLNDEALELELQLPDVPHVQNPDRVAAAKLAIEELDSQVIVMDDGFQHRRLQRDLDIVLIDSTKPFGFEHLLPRGLLRESVSSLKRADLVIATRADQVEQQELALIRGRMQRYATHCGWAEAVHQPKQLRDCRGTTKNLEVLAGKRCVLFCGIGNPQAFAQSVKSCGGIVQHLIEFPDHHLFNANDVASIEAAVVKLKAEPANGDVFLLCTGKDLAKVNVESLGGVPLYAFEVGLELRFGADTFRERMDQIIQSVHSEHIRDSA